MTQTVQEIGKELFAYAKKKEKSFDLFKLQWWNQQLLKMSMQDSGLKDQMFRFVDVLPTLGNSQQITKYFGEYLGNWNSTIGTLIDRSSTVGALSLLSETAIKTGVKIMAKTFIVGSTTEEALVKIRELEKKDQCYTLDILGELAVSEKESEEYLEQYLDLIRGIPNANLSVKLSSLYSQINPVPFDQTKEILKDRLRVIYKEAKERGAFVNVDLEHYYWKDLTFAAFKELLMEDEFRDWKDAGIVLQGYLVDSKKELENLIAWTKERGTPIMVRLVKGAYWDYETTIAKQTGWPCPVYTDKAKTDANYEECLELLFENHKHTKPAVASHNIRSMAYALKLAEKHKLEKHQYEFQMLYGMVDSLKEYMANKDIDIRVYLPYGELIPGMAYLVRRLLENTANESFLKQGFSDGISEDVLLKDPVELIGKNLSEVEESKLVSATLQMEKQKMDKGIDTVEKGFATLEGKHLNAFDNAANVDFSLAENRKKMEDALKKANAHYSENLKLPLLINGQEILTDEFNESINPSRFNQVIAKFSMATLDNAKDAIENAHKAFKTWSKTDVKLRAKILKETAEVLRKERFRFNAITVLESGKPWVEADGEVSEAIDFLEYYSDQALDMFSDSRLISHPGEKNVNIYTPLGVAAVISPWNFPLAIMAGMTCASLITGNTAIVKPAEQASVVCYEFIKVLQSVIAKNVKAAHAAGVVNYLPGKGSVIGDHMVRDPKVKLIAFTGSCEVGMGINAIANSDKTVVKSVITEMGGKNGIIVDTTADLDEAVPGILYSAFGYAGQKCSACSRAIVVEDIYDQFVERLVEGAKSMIISEADSSDCFVPAVIDKASYEKCQEYIEIGKKEGRMVVGDLDVPKTGFFVSPSIFADIPADGKLAQDEVFGPVLAVIKAKNIDDAIEIANNTQFGLTGGLFSRSPKNIDKVTREINVGNFYINRSCTGAIVARQAFGGTKLSSIGFKAGGPNYLLQFVNEKTITENTMRRGFTVDE